MYQKTLAVNFLMCVLITPVLYLSDKILLGLGFSNRPPLLRPNYREGVHPVCLGVAAFVLPLLLLRYHQKLSAIGGEVLRATRDSGHECDGPSVPSLAVHRKAPF